MNEVNDFLTIISQSLVGSSFESNWNTMIQDPDFLNLLTGVNEIVDSTHILFPNALTTESEKQAMRDSIHNAVVNKPAFQTELGTMLQSVYEPLIFTALEKIHQMAALHEIPQAILATVQNEVPVAQQGILANVMNDIVSTLENQTPNN